MVARASGGLPSSHSLPTLFIPSGSYSAEAACDAVPTGGEPADAILKASLSDPSDRHQRRGLVSGGGKPVEVQAEPMGLSEEGHDAQPLPLGGTVSERADALPRRRWLNRNAVMTYVLFATACGYRHSCFFLNHLRYNCQISLSSYPLLKHNFHCSPATLSTFPCPFQLPEGVLAYLLSCS